MNKTKQWRIAIRKKTASEILGGKRGHYPDKISDLQAESIHMKVSKNTLCFVLVMALYAIASTLEYSDLVVIEAYSQGVQK